MDEIPVVIYPSGIVTVNVPYPAVPADNAPKSIPVFTIVIKPFAKLFSPPVAGRLVKFAAETLPATIGPLAVYITPFQ